MPSWVLGGIHPISLVLVLGQEEEKEILWGQVQLHPPTLLQCHSPPCFPKPLAYPELSPPWELPLP